MLAHAAVSLGPFAIVWAALCLIAAALVADAMLRDPSEIPDRDRVADIAHGDTPPMRPRD